LKKLPALLKENGDHMLEQNMKQIHFTILPEWDGLKLEDLLTKVWILPRKMVHQFRMEKSIKIGGEPASFHQIVNKDEHLLITINQDNREEKLNLVPEELPIQILYEDDHLFVVNKPAGMNTHPNQPKETSTLLNALLYYFQEKGENCSFRHIHRLDKDTTGAILFAKHPIAGAVLDRMLEAREIKRVYTALVHGKMAKNEGTITAKIGRDRHHPTRRRVSSTGQDAITQYRVIGYDPKRDLTQIECRLKTGRTHQIRVHLASIGHPLAGDTLYGGKAIFPRQALHAKELSFRHPFTKDSIHVNAPYLDNPPIFPMKP